MDTDIAVCRNFTKMRRNRQPRHPDLNDSKSWDGMLLACPPGLVFISRRGAEARRFGRKGERPLSPIAKQGKIRSGMEFGTPFPVAAYAAMWKRRIRIAPPATRGTDARPSTSIATKRSLAHISCEGLRQPSERRERTPVSNTCHSV